MATTTLLVPIVRDEIYYGSGYTSPPRGRRVASDICIELHAKIVVLAAQTHILLLEVTDANLGRGQSSNLLWGEVEGGLKLGDSLFELWVGEKDK